MFRKAGGYLPHDLTSKSHHHYPKGHPGWVVNLRTKPKLSRTQCNRARGRGRQAGRPSCRIVPLHVVSWCGTCLTLLHPAGWPPQHMRLCVSPRTPRRCPLQFLSGAAAAAILAGCGLQLSGIVSGSYPRQKGGQTGGRGIVDTGPNYTEPHAKSEEGGGHGAALTCPLARPAGPPDSTCHGPPASVCYNKHEIGEMQTGYVMKSGWCVAGVLDCTSSKCQDETKADVCIHADDG